VSQHHTEASEPTVISGLPVLDSTGLDWHNLRVTQWQDVAPQEAYEAALPNHLIVVHTTPQPICVFERADAFRAEGTARPGDVNVLSSSEEAFCRWNKPLCFIRLELLPAYLQHVAAQIDHPNSDHLQVIHAFHKRDANVLQISQWLLEELRNGGMGGKLYVDSLINLLSIHLLRNYTLPSTSSCQIGSSPLTPRQVARAIDYMHAHLDCDISLEDLAKAAYASPAHLIRLFKRFTGCPPHRFLIRLRAEHARELLLTGTPSIAEVAAQVGFADQSHLTRHFKRIFGVTPKKILMDR